MFTEEDEELTRKVDGHENRIACLEADSKINGGLLKDIHTALMGTLEKAGRLREIDDHSRFIEACKKRKEDKDNIDKLEKIDWVKWIERGAIVSVLGWIIAKIKGV